MNITIKEKDHFRLIMKKEPCMMPEDLNNIEMIQEQVKDGKIVNSSTYQFFMTQDELETLAKALVA